jgi:DNA helicase INO80
MQNYWRKYDKEARESQKKAEKEAAERRKREEEIREAKRQQRKLNYLLTQTELFSHFIAKKMNGEYFIH